MTVGELLKQYLREPLSQKEVAMSWHKRAQALDGAPWKPDTIESHLSRCLRDQRQGVQFFFGDRARAALLLDLLDVPRVDRDPIYAAADELLKVGKDRPPRLIIDVTARSGRVDSKRLFEALRAVFVEPRALAPALLLLTEEQYNDLPRSFDHHKDWLSVEIVAEAEVGSRLADLGSASALVASFKRHDPTARWLAIDLDQKLGRLVVEPEDGLERFARDGALPLPVVAHDLAELMPNAAPPRLDLDSIGPIQQRRAMVDLGSEDRAERLGADPAWRLGLARALGVVATATPRDRVEAELRNVVAQFGFETLPSMTANVFATFLARARRHTQTAMFVRVEDRIEVINPEPTQPGLDHPRVVVHRIEAPEPAVVRIRSVLESWTQGDFEADPFLHRLMIRLDPNRRETLALLHARALLLRQPLSPMRQLPVADWRSALARLLAGKVPRATLRLPAVSPSANKYWTVTTPDQLRAAFQGRADLDVRVLSHPRPAVASGIPIARGDAAVLAITQDQYGKTFGESGIANFDVTGEPLRIAGEKWLDAFDAWSDGRRIPGHRLPGIATQPMELLPWDDADRHLARVWLALREAGGLAPAVELDDGRVLLCIGDGIAAMLEVTETAEHVGTRGILDVVDASTAGQSEHWTLRVGVDGGITCNGRSPWNDRVSHISSIEFALPPRVTLLGEKVRAEIEFVGAPLLSRRGSRTVIAAAEAVSQAKRRDDDEAEERERDDDDD